MYGDLHEITLIYLEFLKLNSNLFEITLNWVELLELVEINMKVH